MDKLVYVRAMLAVMVLTILVIIWSLRKYREYGFSFISMIPIINRRYLERQAKKEIKDAEKGIEYRKPGEDDPDGKKFQAFLMDLPKYQIEDNFVASHLRSLMKSAGVEYKQIVLVNKADIHDTCLFARKSGQYFIHGKGTYFNPWECVKYIFYWDIIDSRPLIDMTDEMDWRNPEMCAEVVTAVTNTKTMLGQEKRLDELQKTMTYVLYCLGLVAILALVSIYYQNDATNKIIAILIEIKKAIP